MSSPLRDSSGSIPNLFLYPLHFTQARALTPTLALIYATSSATTLWGRGFEINATVYIQRNIVFGCANYTDPPSSFKEGFVHSEYGELIAMPNGDRNKTATLDGIDYAISYYQPRSAHQPLTIEYWQSKDQGGFWLVRNQQGLVYCFGDPADEKNTTVAVVQNPSNPTQTFQWNLREVLDAAGNKIRYEYSSDADFPNAPYPNPYLSPQRISYGNYFDKNQTQQYAFSIDFCYAPPDSNTETYTPPPPQWRKDISLDYRAGFLLATQRLCYRVELRHHFLEEAIPNVLVHYWDFSYTDTDGLTRLDQITSIGRCINLKGEQLLEKEPVISFSYTPFFTQGEDKKNEPPQFTPLVFPENAASPGMNYQFVDLYQEGLPGLLSIQEQIPLFWRNKGFGGFSTPTILPDFPQQLDLSVDNLLIPLGDGLPLHLLNRSNDTQGQYILRSNPTLQQFSWENWQPSNAPVEEEIEWVDVSGRGYPDAICWQTDTPYFYPNVGEKGFLDSKDLCFPSSDTSPNPEGSSDQWSFRDFTPLFGDGLLHRVVIEEDTFTVWPNIGNGNFASPLQWKLPAYQGVFNPSRIRLADVTGTGTTDLLYLYSDRVDIYLNTGSGFSSSPHSVSFPTPMTDSDRFQIVDVLGNGNANFWLTQLDVNAIQHQYAQLSPCKAFLLESINNTNGMRLEFTYQSSMKNYLSTQISGKLPYPVLPFPMTVVGSITEIDHITKSTHTQSYEFYGANYDPTNRKFCGFSYVEITNTQDDGKAVAPQLTKRWFCSGIAENNQTLNSQGSLYNSCYYSLGNTIPLNIFFASPDQKISAELEKQALLALNNQCLREEIYAVAQKQPLQVEQTSFSIFLNSNENSEGAFIIASADQVNDEVDEQAESRITRSMVLEWDEDCHPTQTLKIAYGRAHPPADLLNALDAKLSITGSARERILSEQTPNFALFQKEQHFQKTAQETQSPLATFVFSPVLLSRTQYDLTSLLHLEMSMPRDAIISNIQAVSPNQLMGALLRCHKHYYWDSLDQKQIFDPSTNLTLQPLVHHVEDLLGDDKQVSSWYQPLLLNDEEVDTPLMRAGFIHETDNWWKPGLVRYYQKAFRLPCRTLNIEAANDEKEYAEDQLWRKFEKAYDSYQMRLIETTQYLWRESNSPSAWSTQIYYDYQTLLPSYTIDHNQNTAINLHDPLGRLLATTHQGTLGKVVLGNPLPPIPDKMSLANFLNELRFELLQRLLDVSLADLLKDLPTTLSNWVSLHHYQSEASPDSPPFVLTLQAFCYEKNLTPIEPDQSALIQATVQYLDASQQVIQTKRLHEQQDKITWLSSGWTAYGAANQILSIYLPYESEDWEYDSLEVYTKNQAALLPPLYNFYDARSRLIQQISPKGYVREAVYTPWTQLLYDENDTLAQTLPTITLSPEEKKLINAELAEEHAHTPLVLFYNPQAQICAITEIRHDESKEANVYVPLITSMTHDALDQTLSYQDPRIPKPHDVLTYNLLGQVVCHEDVEQMPHYALLNREGQPFRHTHAHWLHVRGYDSFSRVLSEQVLDLTATNQNLTTVESKTYGEQLWEGSSGDPRDQNLCGQLISIRSADQLTQYLSFNLDGHCLKQQKNIMLPNIRALNPAIQPKALEKSTKGENLTLSKEFSVAGHVLLQQVDGNSTLHLPGTTRKDQYNSLGLIATAQFQVTKTATLSLPLLTYDSSQRYQKIAYGNGLETQFSYDARTSHLNTLCTQDSKKEDIFALQYTYDPTGNVLAEQRPSQILPFTTPIHLPDASILSRYNTLYHLQTIQGALELKNTPIPINTRVSAHLTQGATPPEFNTYTAQFTYDNGDNLTNLSHQGTQPWQLIYAICADSDHLESLSGSDDSKKAVQYEDGGQISALGETENWKWDYQGRLVGFQKNTEAKETTAALETYGYAKETSDHEQTQLTYPSLSRYSPSFFGAQSSENDPTLPRYQNRQYKVWQHPIDNSTETIEEIYLGNYQRKRIYRASDKWQPSLVLECYRYHLQTPLGLLGTLYCWTKDDLGLEVEGKPTPQNPAYESQYHLIDHLGSVRIDTDKLGAIQTYREYSAYGSMSFSLSRDPHYLARQGYQYSSKEQDGSGSYYYGDRYYDPHLARWLNPDPAGLVDGLNSYDFVHNNPGTLVDWNGDVEVLDFFSRTARSRRSSPLNYTQGLSNTSKKKASSKPSIAKPQGGIKKATAAKKTKLPNSLTQAAKASERAVKFTPNFSHQWLSTAVSGHRLVAVGQNSSTGDNFAIGIESGLGPGNRNQVAAHTEPKALGAIRFTDKNDVLTLIGREPPCNSCQGAMSDHITNAIGLPTSQGNQHQVNPKAIFYISMKGEKIDGIDPDSYKGLALWLHEPGTRKFSKVKLSKEDRKHLKTWTRGVFKNELENNPHRVSTFESGAFTTAKPILPPVPGLN